MFKLWKVRVVSQPCNRGKNSYHILKNSTLSSECIKYLCTWNINTYVQPGWMSIDLHVQGVIKDTFRIPVNVEYLCDVKVTEIYEGKYYGQ